MLFHSRSGRGTYLLRWRLRLLTVGAILGVLGMARDATWMIWTAVAVLIVGMLLRFVPAPDEE